MNLKFGKLRTDDGIKSRRPSYVGGGGSDVGDAGDNSHCYDCDDDGNDDRRPRRKRRQQDDRRRDDFDGSDDGDRPLPRRRDDRRHRSSSSDTGGRKQFRRRDVPIKLNEYDAATSIDSFLSKFRTCSEYYHWSEVDKAAHLRSLLAGNATNLI